MKKDVRITNTETKNKDNMNVPIKNNKSNKDLHLKTNAITKIRTPKAKTLKLKSLQKPTIVKMIKNLDEIKRLKEI